MFTKTDLAKFENTWMQRPHVVSKGAQKNFLAFTEELARRSGFLPDLRYFEDVVAKAILFRNAERIVHKQEYGGYRANIVTYTLAWLSHATQQRLDLGRIWENQAVSPALAAAIARASKAVHEVITSPPGGRNVTEWCKSEGCWQRCIELQMSLEADLVSELIELGSASRPVNRGIDQPDEGDREQIARVKAIPAEVWFRIANWAKETKNLMPWQRSLAFSIGKVVSGKRDPSRKQAIQSIKIYEEATRLGFRQ